MIKIPGFLKIYKDLLSTIRFQFFHAALDSGLLEAFPPPIKAGSNLKT
jgi:hypothetical protein